MSTRSFLARSVMVLCLIGLGVPGAQAGRETEAVGRGPAAAGEPEPEIFVGSIPSGADLVAMVERHLPRSLRYEAGGDRHRAVSLLDRRSTR